MLVTEVAFSPLVPSFEYSPMQELAELVPGTNAADKTRLINKLEYDLANIFSLIPDLFKLSKC